MEDMKSGNPRTLGMHQEMQLRNVLRQEAQQNSQAISREGFNVAMVTSVNAMGHVQLEGFTTEEDDGTWFAVLNHVTPKPGEMVIFGYVKGVPIVFGVMPTEETTPWRGPRSGLPDTFFIDDFDVGAGGAAGDIGLARWVWAGSGSFAIVYEAGTDPAHPGIWQLHAGNVAGSYQYAATWSAMYKAEALSEVEYMVKTTGDVAAAQFIIGMTDHILNYPNAIYFWYHTGNATLNWYFRRNTAGAANLMQGDTGLPVVLDHWYKMNFKHKGVDTWVGTVTDVTNPNNPIEGAPVELTGVTTVAMMMGMFTQCLTVATTSRVIHADYLWYSKLGLSRGGR